MSLLTGKWGFLALGIVIGGTLLRNKIVAIPVINKIPTL
jgi:hypothetical protein